MPKVCQKSKNRNGCRKILIPLEFTNHDLQSSIHKKRSTSKVILTSNNEYRNKKPWNIGSCLFKLKLQQLKSTKNYCSLSTPVYNQSFNSLRQEKQKSKTVSWALTLLFHYEKLLCKNEILTALQFIISKSVELCWLFRNLWLCNYHKFVKMVLSPSYLGIQKIQTVFISSKCKMKQVLCIQKPCKDL